jgi:hypothetical protein
MAVMASWRLRIDHCPDVFVLGDFVEFGDEDFQRHWRGV